MGRAAEGLWVFRCLLSCITVPVHKISDAKNESLAVLKKRKGLLLTDDGTKQEEVYYEKGYEQDVGTAAAAVCMLFTVALNTGPVFAKETGRLPVIGGVARILTFRSYETEKDDIAVSVEIPTIEMITEDTGITVNGINQEILARCDRYADEALLRAEEYRTAYKNRENGHTEGYAGRGLCGTGK